MMEAIFGVLCGLAVPIFYIAFCLSEIRDALRDIAKSMKGKP